MPKAHMAFIYISHIFAINWKINAPQKKNENSHFHTSELLVKKHIGLESQNSIQTFILCQKYFGKMSEGSFKYDLSYCE